MKAVASLFCDEACAIDRAETLLAAGDAMLPAEEFAMLLEHYKKLYRQSMRLVKMGDRMQGQLSRLNDKLAASEEKYRSIFESSIQGVFRLDGEGRFLDLNPAMARILGYESPKTVLGERAGLDGNTFLCAGAYALLLSVLDRQGVVKDHPLHLRQRDGDEVWVEVCVRGSFDQNRRLLEMEGLAADVTEKRRMLAELKNLARRDDLTGLWNRRYFFELGQRELDRADRDGDPVALIYFDVDHFKDVNDTYGHEAGDRVLAELAGLGGSILRKIDVFGRMGGEEFAVLLPGAGVEGGHKAAEKLRSAIEARTISLAQADIRCTASFGVSARRPWGQSLEDMVLAADKAMYIAKRSGRNTIVSVQ